MSIVKNATAPVPKTARALKTCSTCNGQGQVVMNNGFFRMAQTCPKCRGTGKIVTEYCPECADKDESRITRTVDVKIPPGVDNDSQLRVRGEGEVGPGGNGDLFLFIKVKNHTLFERHGQDLKMDLPVSFTKSALGGEEKIKTLKEEVVMKIPEGTQSGKVFRMRGQGMPDVHGHGVGDLYVRAMIAVPSNLNSRQRELMEELAQELGESNGKGSLKDKFKKAFK